MRRRKITEKEEVRKAGERDGMGSKVGGGEEGVRGRCRIGGGGVGGR